MPTPMPTTPMNNALDDGLLAEMESFAVEIARGAGEKLAAHFGGSLRVAFKDERERDPVTNADTEAQDFLARRIQERFPNHGILGEEDDEDGDSEAAPDFLWVLDPLDGTKNFMHGIPVYACSVGLLHRGEPVVGAVFTPWPVGEGGGAVHHARRGGGAFTDGAPIRAADLDAPHSGQLMTAPGMFDRIYAFGKPMRGKAGDPRVTGSIAYELVLAARGATQYMYTSTPSLWDVAGGAALALEAGAALMVGERRGGFGGLFPSISWRESRALVDGWTPGETTFRDLRRWARPLILASPPVARTVSANLRFKPSIALRLRLRRMMRRRKR